MFLSNQNLFTDYKKISEDLYLENLQLKAKIAELEEKLLDLENVRIINAKNAEVNSRNAEFNAMYSKWLLGL